LRAWCLNTSCVHVCRLCLKSKVTPPQLGYASFAHATTCCGGCPSHRTCRCVYVCVMFVCILRTCNNLLRRLSKSQDLQVCVCVCHVRVHDLQVCHVRVHDLQVVCVCVCMCVCVSCSCSWRTVCLQVGILGCADCMQASRYAQVLPFTMCRQHLYGVANANAKVYSWHLVHVCDSAAPHLNVNHLSACAQIQRHWNIVHVHAYT